MGNEVAWARVGAVFAAMVASLVATGGARAADADEAELKTWFETVDVWHFPVDATVRYNDQDIVVTRELVLQPAPAGRLCYTRFDLIKAEGDYGYGLEPASSPGPRNDARWGVNVLKRGTVLNQYYSSLRLNVVQFYVDGPRSADARDICARKQAAPTAEAGNAYKGPWADLVTKARAIHGWPASAAK